MDGPPPSPFVRPLLIAAGVMVFYCVRRLGSGQGLALAQFLIVGACFLLGAVLTGFAQLVTKKQFNWVASFLAVLGLSLAVALLMLGLKKAGLIYQ